MPRRLENGTVSRQNASQADLPAARSFVQVEHPLEDERCPKCQRRNNDECAPPVKRHRDRRQQGDAQGSGQRTAALYRLITRRRAVFSMKRLAAVACATGITAARLIAPKRAARNRTDSVIASPVDRLLATTASRQTNKVRR